MLAEKSAESNPVRIDFSDKKSVVSSNKLGFVERDGEILFTAEEVGRHLGYGKPAEAVNRLCQRNYSELKRYSVSVKLTATDGKSYEHRAFTEEGVYIISMLARTSEAKKFRARVALLLRRVRREQAERMAELAREAGYAQGLEAAAPALRSATAGIWDLSKNDKAKVRRVTRYKKMGLSSGDIAKLLDIHQRKVGAYLSAAKSMGFLS